MYNYRALIRKETYKMYSSFKSVWAYGVVRFAPVI